MEIFEGYRIKLYPTEMQRKRLFELLDTSRYCYNWGIEQEKLIYSETGRFTRNYDLYKLLSKHRQIPENEWLLNTPLSIQRLTLDKVVMAYERFFNKQCRYPRFKTRKSIKKSFPIRSERIYFNGNSVSFEGMGHNNRILCKDHKVPKGPNVKYCNSTISFDGDDFWICLSVKLEQVIEFEPQGEALGIDLGIRKLATLSNGKTYISPDTSKLERRLRRIDKRVSKDMHKRLKLSMSTRTKYENIPKSKNQLKREKSRRSTIRRIVNINNSFINNMTKEIVMMNPSYIVLEDLRVREMQQKYTFTRAEISKARFRTIRTQLEKKCNTYGIKVYIADSQFPSSQICSNCGNRHFIDRARIYRCPKCGMTMDRDLNAAINLRNYPLAQGAV